MYAGSHVVEDRRAERYRGESETEKDEHGVGTNEQAYEQAGDQCAVPLEKRDAANATPAVDENRGDRRAHEREEYGAVTHGRKLDRNLIEPPGKGEPDHEDRREGIDRLAPLGRFACSAHAC